MKKTDLTGQRFGRLVVKERISGYKGKKPVHYKCLCDCGKYTTVYGGNLGRCVNSCGCLYKDSGIRKRVPEDEKRLNAMRRYYKRNAKLRTTVEWGLTKDEFDTIVKLPCKYCGYFDNKKFSGIDRVDNNRGYTIENSVPCCRWCNAAKMDRTLSEFKKWGKDLYERLLVHV